MLGERLSRPPAPLYEGVRFAVRHMMHHKPFAVQEPWGMPPTYEIKVRGHRISGGIDRPQHCLTPT